mmetsp:Transcript_5889/g.9706  ORF Transcript_5889/g.9706 Transcript_5889/m.9706 type:complete len:293 (-) Transcript_5889:76-954(-)
MFCSTLSRLKILPNAARCAYSGSSVRQSAGTEAYLNKLYNLEGKTAIVTGATGGIGSAVAEGLWLAGVNVVVHGRLVEGPINLIDQLYKKHNRNSGLLPYTADVTSQGELTAMVDKTVETFGGIDILMNNAGMNLPENSFPSRSPEDWAKICNINMTGPIMLTQLCLPYLKASSRGGRIINTASIGGHAGLPKNTLYTMTKGGVLLFTKSLAVELAEENVTVNSISPGVFMTPMNAKFAPGTKQHDEIVRMIPMKKMGTPEELVGAVLYLASDAGAYSTGTDIIVDGGYSSQ